MYWAFTAVPAFLAFYLLPTGSRELIRYAVPALIILEVIYANQVAAKMRALARSSTSGPTFHERIKLIPFAIGVFIYIFIGMSFVPPAWMAVVGSIGTILIFISKMNVGRSRMCPGVS